MGLALRVGLAASLGLSAAPEPGTDQQEYDTYAWSVAQGRGYRGMSADVADRDHLTAFRPPGTSLAWAAIYGVVGHRYDAVRLLHCLASALTILLVYDIGRRVFSPSVGLLAAAGYAIYPTALLFSTQLLSEPLGTFWFLAALAMCLRFAECPAWDQAVAAGILLGVAILTRPHAALMAPLIGFWVLWQFRQDRRAWVEGLLIPVACLATMSPWIVRNYLIFGAFIPISTLSGSGLLQGNNRIVATDPRYYGYSIWDSYIPEYRQALQTAGDEVERDRRAKRLALQWLRDNPDRWWYLARAKTVRAWTPFLQSSTPRYQRISMLLSWGPVLILFVLAFLPTLVGLLRGGRPGWLLHLVIVNNVVLNLIFWGEARYRHSIEPICLIFAAQALAYLMASERRALDGRRSKGAENRPADPWATPTLAFDGGLQEIRTP
ncbi:ArnT family glycosyltransferase [Paludisphaera rhizosphaerae]|uniref:ArnT family glycosyltransferase n=1 Tax=Paludisphaera rhizosphaerae TaxID=2711216 RepID=UPI0013ED2BDD|nr:glycosyltransferase family 39 protein [Paludisphaera rhizosphaerae]